MSHDTMIMSEQQINGGTLAAWAVPYYMLGIGAVDDGADPMSSQGWCSPRYKETDQRETGSSR